MATLAIALTIAGCGRGAHPSEDVADRPPVRAAADASRPADTLLPPDAGVTSRPDPELEEKLGWFDDEHGASGAMDWLVEHADRAHPHVRRRVENEAEGLGFGRAVEVLGRMSYEEDVPLLVQKLDGTSDSGITHIIVGLSQHKTDAAYHAMIALTESENDLVAQQAVVWLGNRGEERVREPLEVFLDHESSEIRWSAVRALIDLGAEPSRAKLKARRKVEKDREVKRELDRALK